MNRIRNIILCSLLISFFGCEHEPKCSHQNTSTAIKEYLIKKLNNPKYYPKDEIDRYDKNIEQSIRRFVLEGIEIENISEKSNSHDCECDSDITIVLKPEIKKLLESQYNFENVNEPFLKRYKFDYKLRFDNQKQLIVTSNFNVGELSSAMIGYIVLETSLNKKYSASHNRRFKILPSFR